MLKSIMKSWSKNNKKKIVDDVDCMKCKKCGENLTISTHQTRSADEGMTNFFVCNSCNIILKK